MGSPIEPSALSVTMHVSSGYFFTPEVEGDADEDTAASFEEVDPAVAHAPSASVVLRQTATEGNEDVMSWMQRMEVTVAWNCISKPKRAANSKAMLTVIERRQRNTLRECVIKAKSPVPTR